MGSIRRFDLRKLSASYSAVCFFETGTWHGDAVAYALDAGFKKIISVEIMPELAEEAKKRFQSYQNVTIIEGNSAPTLLNELPALKGNCIFWLDAHFPGADAGMSQYDSENDEARRLPLEKEIEAIKICRAGYRDVVIIDDLRIYEDGPFENGNSPEETLPKQNRNIDFVFKQFSDTHSIERSYLDEGYLLLLPRPEKEEGPDALSEQYFLKSQV
jgi:hypothetical protein